MADGPSALSVAEQWPPDLVVLDLMLPGIDGLEVCRRLRAAHGSRQALPVIMLTALGEESDRVTGLEAGADDYVTKPFSPRELALRVQAVLRRAAAAQAAPPGPFRAGRFEVDLAARRIRRDGRGLALTIREFDLLAFFLPHPGQAFTRAQLLEQVWGWSYGDLSTVTVCVRRMCAMVEDLFELSRIQLGTLSLSLDSVGAGDLVSDTVASMEPLARARRPPGRAEHPGRRPAAASG